MTVYVIAQLAFIRREKYDQYQARFWDVFKLFKGQLVAADEHPKVLEGDWNHDKLVMMSFPDERDAREFLESAEYQAIAQDRKAGAKAVVVMVRGSRLPSKDGG
jgi:uncharacterized protein (DUF1330 family)